MQYWIRALGLVLSLAAFEVRAGSPRITVAFPAEGAAVATDRQTYLIGKIVPANQTLTVNGKIVTPWRTGSFICMVPVVSGPNTVVLQAGAAVLRRTFRVPSPPPPWNGRSLRVREPRQPLGVYTGETVWLECEAPPKRSVYASVGERTIPLTAQAGNPAHYTGRVVFQAPAEKVPVVFFTEGLADAPAADLTVRVEWPVMKVTGPLLETRLRSEPGDGDTLGFPPSNLLISGAGFVGSHTRLWLDGKERFIDARFLTPVPNAAPRPPRTLALPDIARSFGPHPPADRTPSHVLVVLDPGHGADATGAIGPSGLTEKAINLQQAKVIRNVLKQAGFRVLMTRETDRNPSLYDRARFALQKKADAFISIHHNATPPASDPRLARHIASYAWNDIGQCLAQALHPHLAAVTPIADGGVRNASFAVCRNPVIPSCLLELDFINCPEGEESILRPAQQQRVAEAVLAGIKDWLKSSSSHP